MKLPWKQLASLVLIMTISAAAFAPPTEAERNAMFERSRQVNAAWLAHQPTVGPPMFRTKPAAGRTVASAWADRLSEQSKHPTVIASRLIASRLIGRYPSPQTLLAIGSHVSTRTFREFAMGVNWAERTVSQIAKSEFSPQPLRITRPVMGPTTVTIASTTMRMAGRFVAGRYSFPVAAVVQLGSKVRVRL